MSHKHVFVSRDVNMGRKQIQQKCKLCSKWRNVAAVRCESCGLPPLGGFPSGHVCQAEPQCIRGYVVKRREPVCCCGRDGEKCENCALSGGLIHVCLLPTDEEVDYEARLAAMTVRKTAAGLEVKDRAAALDVSVGPRSGQR